VSAGAALLTCLLAAACTAGPSGSPSEQPSPSPTPSSPSSGPPQPVTLTFAVYGQPGVLRSYRQLARAYTTLHPEVTLQVEAVDDPVASEARLAAEFEAGTPPDVFLARQTTLPRLVQDERVQPVDELLEQRGVEFGDKVQRLGLEAFAAESALQCMPNDVSPYVVFYNRRLVDPEAAVVEEGERPPDPESGWTWQQFSRAAERSSTGGVKGLYLAPRLTTLMPLVRSAGADVVDDPETPTTLTLAEEATRQALVEILSVARDERITPSPAELERQDAVTRFENGRLGMMIGTRDLVPRLREKAGLEFDVFPLPSLGRFRTMADLTGYCIARDSAHVPAAADFLAYASGPDGSRILASSGAIVPANLEALHSESFTQPTSYPQNSEVFDSVIRRADPMPSVAAWPDVVSATQPLLDRLFYSRVLDLDTLLPRIDEVSAPLLEPPAVTPSPTPEG
jgi:multiple sugar transport system substrate-binding protein